MKTAPVCLSTCDRTHFASNKKVGQQKLWPWNFELVNNLFQWTVKKKCFLRASYFRFLFCLNQDRHEIKRLTFEVVFSGFDVGWWPKYPLTTTIFCGGFMQESTHILELGHICQTQGIEKHQLYLHLWNIFVTTILKTALAQNEMIKSPQERNNFLGSRIDKQQLHSGPQPDLHLYCIFYIVYCHLLGYCIVYCICWRHESVSSYWHLLWLIYSQTSRMSVLMVSLLWLVLHPMQLGCSAPKT